MPTANPLSVHIKVLLAAHVATSGWTIEIGIMPDIGNDNVILIVDSLSPPSNPKWLIDFPSIQVRVRGVKGTYLATWLEAKAVKDIILGIDSFDTEANGDRIVSITSASDIGFIGRDENQRPEFSMNFNTIVEPFASSDTSRIALPGSGA